MGGGGGFNSLNNKLEQGFPVRFPFEGCIQGYYKGAMIDRPIKK